MDVRKVTITGSTSLIFCNVRDFTYRTVEVIRTGTSCVFSEGTRFHG